MGPPGAGKGTQAFAVRTRYRAAHISTGDILRENVKRGSELGLRAKSFMDEGKLVPDNLIIDMVKDRISMPDAQEGFLFDGFPRTAVQAEAFDALLSDLSIHLDAVILLEVSDEEVVRRLTRRRVCSSCNAVFNTKSHPTKKEGACDVCGGKVVQRDDDKEPIIRNRLEIYRKDTEPVVKYYERKGLLHRVDGSGGSDTVLKFLISFETGRT
jgi:adenylate kinase